MRTTKPDIHLMTFSGIKRALLWPKTRSASKWVHDNFGNNYEVFAQGIVVEPHLVKVLLQGLQASDLNYIIQRS